MKRSFLSSGDTAPLPKKQLVEQNMYSACSINKDYKNESFKEKVTTAWREKTNFKDVVSSGRVLSEPFQCCLLPNFLTAPVTMETDPQEFLIKLKNELLRLKFYEKNNDLYQFHQSDDLKKFSDHYCISALRCFLREQCLPWLRTVTGLELTDTIDITCSKYDYTDVLLCHDDELEGRRIAFILYLVPEWTAEDGGTLDLFSVDNKGQPSSISQSLIPEWNNFVFFDVNAVSFHQVSEVLTTKTRLSVSGWFHGPPPPRPPPVKEIPRPLHPPLPMGLEVLEDWVNSVYLDIGVQGQIQAQFEDDSQIELPDFLLEDKYKQICEEVKVCKKTLVGPANRRHVQEVRPEGGVLEQLTRVLTSQPFCLLLSHLTGLDLAENVIRDPSVSTGQRSPVSSNSAMGGHTSRLQNGTEENKTSKQDMEQANTAQINGVSSSVTVPGEPVALCRCDVTNWSHGDYTLAGEGGNHAGFLLDSQLHLCSDDWSPDYGGVISYIAKDADEELLSLSPRPNALSLVYRDPDTLSFTKYINHRASVSGAWLSTLHSIYVENNNSNS